MVRRRSDAGTFTFDLEPDEDSLPVAAGSTAGEQGVAGPGVAGPGAAEPGVVEPPVLVRAGAAVVRRLRSWPRRRLIAVGTALGVVVAGAVGTPVALTQARQRAWERVAATTPGAVLDLSHAPTETWRTKLAGAQPVALVSGTLVVTDGQWGSNHTLHGLDPATGTVRWSTVVPDGGECTVGVNPWLGGLAPRMNAGDTMVCVADTQRRVAVVDGDGALLAARELTDAVDAATDNAATDDAAQWASRAAHRVLVLSGGEVIRIDRLGDPGAPARLGPLTPYGDGPRTAPLLDPLVLRDVRVRVEDAATGAVRWETVLDVPDLPAGAVVDENSMCVGWEDDGRAADPEGQWSDGLDATRLHLRACGLDAALDLATGDVVGQEDGEDDASIGTPGRAEWLRADVPLADGLWAAVRMRSDPVTGKTEAESRITRVDGTAVGTVPGLVIPPLASDGTGAALLITAPFWEGTDDGEVVAYDADTVEPRWRAPLPHARLLAHTADVVVLSDGRTVTGLDRETGRTRWQRALTGTEPPVTPGIDAGLSVTTGPRPDPSVIHDALTDGRRVLVAMPDHLDDATYAFDGPTALTTLDLATGDVVWQATSPRVPYPVAGRLIRFDADAVVGLG